MNKAITGIMGGSAMSEQENRLPECSVYRSVGGRREYFALYNKSIAKLPCEIIQTRIKTTLGETCVSRMGNPRGTPIIVLPGMSIAGPMMLEFFSYLAADHLLLAPDIVGQPGRSDDVPFSPAGNAYGHWMIEILDSLGLERGNFAATSFGGSICLDVLKIAPERVGKQALIVTAGLTPKLPYLRIYAQLLTSWLAYRHVPVRSRLGYVARPLSRRLSDDNLDYLDVILRQTAFWRHRPAGPFFPADFDQTQTEPVLIAFAKNDFLFPFRQTIAHATATLPIQQKIILDESGHMPDEREMAAIRQAVQSYFRN